MYTSTELSIETLKYTALAAAQTSSGDEASTMAALSRRIPALYKTTLLLFVMVNADVYQQKQALEKLHPLGPTSFRHATVNISLASLSAVNMSCSFTMQHPQLYEVIIAYDFLSSSTNCVLGRSN